MFKMARFYSCQSMLTAVQELSRAVGWSSHRGPPSVLVSVLLDLVIGSQLPPEPAFQEDQARAAWCVMVHLRSHTDALALHPTEQSGRKAAGFKGRGHRADLQAESVGMEMWLWLPGKVQPTALLLGSADSS